MEHGCLYIYIMQGLGMYRRVYVTRHIKDPMPLSEKSRTLSPGGRFPPSFIHQVIIITGLNKLGLYVVAMKMASDAECLGGKHPPKQNNG